MSCILKIDFSNCEGYLALYKSEFELFKRLSHKENFNRQQFLKGSYINYNVTDLQLLFKNVDLAYSELKDMGLVNNYVAHCLKDVLYELSVLHFELANIVVKYPYINTEISLENIVIALYDANIINDEEYTEYLVSITEDVKKYKK